MEVDPAQETPKIGYLSGKAHPESLHWPLAEEYRRETGQWRDTAASGWTGRMCRWMWKSGNGFADLAQYDADRNGWIDEADPIWEKLLIWTKDEDGKDKLYHLADLGVGAIGLANVSTEFALNSEKDNTNNAMIRNTGIFLYENGNVSTIQHLDLAR